MGIVERLRPTYSSLYSHIPSDASQSYIQYSLLEILSFATNHYATGMQLVIVCNYFGHVCNYKFGIV